MRRMIGAVLGASLLLSANGLAHAQQRGQYNGHGQSIETLERVPSGQRSKRQSVELGQAYYAAGRLDDASRAADAIIKQDPYSADAWRIKGDLARERGDWSGALRAYERAVRSDPRRAEFELLRGQALMELGRVGEADQSFVRYQALQQVQYVPQGDEN